MIRLSADALLYIFAKHAIHDRFTFYMATLLKTFRGMFAGRVEVISYSDSRMN